MLLGIDYGSKLAGTTAICFGTNPKDLSIYCSEKDKDADKFILTTVQTIKPFLVGIDAPLSVPPGVVGQGGDYFYRAADKALKAMSPMFLGGLTARAMQIKHLLENIGSTKCVEVYPKALMQLLSKANPFPLEYKDKKGEHIAEACLYLNTHSGTKLEKLRSWHEFDAVLAWLSTYRYYRGEATIYGLTDQGTIAV